MPTCQMLKPEQQNHDTIRAKDGGLTIPTYRGHWLDVDSRTTTLRHRWVMSVEFWAHSAQNKTHTSKFI